MVMVWGALQNIVCHWYTGLLFSGKEGREIVSWFTHRRTRDINVMNEEASDNRKQGPHGGKEVDHQNYLTFKQSRNPQPMNATNFSAALLPSELRDRDLFAADLDNIEQTFVRSSQERSIALWKS